jgi:hypothetical protein
VPFKRSSNIGIGNVESLVKEMFKGSSTRIEEARITRWENGAQLGQEFLDRQEIS